MGSTCPTLSVFNRITSSPWRWTPAHAARKRAFQAKEIAGDFSVNGGLNAQLAREQSDFAYYRCSGNDLAGT